MRILTEAEIEYFRQHHPEWEVSDGALKTTYQLPTFREAVALMQFIFLEAERQDHHPDLRNTYNTVSIVLSTHDAGDAVTEKDTAMATYIAEQAEKLQ